MLFECATKKCEGGVTRQTTSPRRSELWRYEASCVKLAGCSPLQHIRRRPAAACFQTSRFLPPCFHGRVWYTKVIAKSQSARWNAVTPRTKDNECAVCILTVRCILAPSRAKAACLVLLRNCAQESYKRHEKSLNGSGIASGGEPCFPRFSQQYDDCNDTNVNHDCGKSSPKYPSHSPSSDQL